jgi:hypothetical protein
MSKKTDILEKYTKLCKKKENSFKTLVDSDKTPTTKYAEYMCKIWMTKLSFESFTLNQLMSTVEKFDKLLPYIENKDIYSQEYCCLPNLKTVVELAEEKKKDSEFVKEDNIQVLIENDEYLLAHILTYEGALKYGKGTKWCISAKNSKGYWESYSRTSHIYFLIRKQPLNSVCDKFAILLRKTEAIVGELEWWNAQDSQIKSDTILNSKWDLITIINVSDQIRSHSIFEYRKRRAKENIKKFENSLTELAEKDLGFDFRILSEDGKKEYAELNKKVESLTEMLREKLK